MITSDPLQHEEDHQRLQLVPTLNANRPTDGTARVGERRLDPGTNIEYYWTGTIWQQVGPVVTGSVPSLTWASRPTSPSDGDRFWCSDRFIEYFWKASAGRWYSTQLYPVLLRSTNSANNPINYTSTVGNAYRGMIPTLTQLNTSGEFLVESVTVASNTQTVYNATSYWIFAFGSKSAAGTETAFINLQLYSPTKTALNTIYHFHGNVGLIYTQTTLAVFFGTIANNTTPLAGTITLYEAIVNCRMVG